MSTQKRKDSARANGAKSCGPVTPEGRARSRAARLTHGLAAGVVVLASESKKRFEALREEYLDEYQPQTRSQVDLVDHLVATRWRLNRVLCYQSALIDLQMARQRPEIKKEFSSCGESIRAAIAYQHLIDDGRALESLNRHEARLSAELRRSMKLLDAQLKNQKRHDEPTTDQPVPAAEPENQKFHHEPSDAKLPRCEEDTPAVEPQPSTVNPPPPVSAFPPVSCLQTPDSSCHKFHHQPSDAKPPRADEHRPDDDPPSFPPPVSCLQAPDSSCPSTVNLNTIE